MVYFCIPGGRVLRLNGRRLVISPIPRKRGRWDACQDISRNRADTAVRDNVVGKGLAAAAKIVARCGIINHRARRTEITLPKRRGGNGEVLRVPEAVFDAKIVCEEKRSVPDDRAAYCEPVIVVSCSGLLCNEWIARSKSA